MSLFFRLLLGHIVGDFALQTIQLVRYKGHSWKGLLLHSGIVTLSTGAFLWDIPWAWPWLIPLFASHLATDWGKVTLSRRFPERRLSFFLLDQFMHVAAIVGIVCLADRSCPYPDLAATIGAGEANLYLLFVLAFLFVFFVVPLLEVQIAYKLARRMANGPIAGDSLAASLQDRLWGGGERTIVLALIYVWLVLGWPTVWFAPLAFIPRIIALRPAWTQPNRAHLYRFKIATSIGCSILVGTLLWLTVPLI